MLYEPTRFDALIDEPWVPARVEDAIAAIVADADAAFDPTALWPAHEWDAREKPLPLSGLYVGAAGVIWALDELQRAGPCRVVARPGRCRGALGRVRAGDAGLLCGRPLPSWCAHVRPDGSRCSSPSG